MVDAPGAGVLTGGPVLLQASGPLMMFASVCGGTTSGFTCGGGRTPAAPLAGLPGLAGRTGPPVARGVALLAGFPPATAFAAIEADGAGRLSTFSCVGFESGQSTYTRHANAPVPRDKQAMSNARRPCVVCVVTITNKLRV